MKFPLLHCALILVCFLAGSAFAGDAGMVVKIPPVGEPFYTLGEYGLFTGVVDTRLVPAPGVLPYQLNTPHFVDYATVRRFVWIPPDGTVEAAADGALIYPRGSMLVLSASYPEDARNPDGPEKLIETRVLVRRDTEWEALQYVWDEKMQEAHYQRAGFMRGISWVHHNGEERSHNYFQPNQNQCTMCHVQDGVFIPLGPTGVKHLNRDVAYAEGTENQLRRWLREGIISGLPEDLSQLPAFPQWDDPASASIEDRARAYLDMNCSGCHRPGGLAYTSGLDLRFEQREPLHYGIFKAPIAAGRGAGIGRFDILPGHPDLSVIVIRMKSTDPGIRMPVIGRGLTHEEGVALVSEWIASLDFPDMEVQQNMLDEQKRRYQSLGGLGAEMAGVPQAQDEHLTMAKE